MREKLIKLPSWIWFVLKLLYPIFVFEVVKLFGMMIVIQITGASTPQLIMLANGVGLVAAIPVLLWLYLNEKRNRIAVGVRNKEVNKEVNKETNGEEGKGKSRQKTIGGKVTAGISVLFLGASMALWINVFLNQIDLSAIEGNYQEVAALQYSIPILAGVFLYGILAPLSEELLFRGLIYQKLKVIVTPVSAIVFSSLLFGIYHGNGIQFVYGSIMGSVIAYCYYKMGHLLIPILFHSGANLASYLAGSSESLSVFCEKPSSVILLLLISVGMFILFLRGGCGKEKA